MEQIRTDVECPICKMHSVKVLDKYRFYKGLAIGIVMVALGCGCIISMYDEHDVDPVIIFGFLFGFGMGTTGIVTIIYSLVKEFLTKKSKYRCRFCTHKF